MPLRARLFVIISLIILLVLAISVVLIIRARKSAPAPAVVLTTTHNVIDKSNFNLGAVANPTLTPATGTPAATPSEAAEQNAAKQLAKIFIERLGSYSSDANFQNVKDVQNIVTPSLWSQLSKTISTSGGQTFVGVTTEVLSVELANWAGTTAQVSVKTRQTTTRNSVSSVSYKDAAAELVKQNDVWLVNNYSWSK